MTRAIVLLLTLLTGFSGLVYQVAWQKYMAVLLGSHSEATAAVLGLFLGGLSYGYHLFGRISTRRVERAAASGEPARLVHLYGVVELMIGFWALSFPLLFEAMRLLSLSLPDTGPALAFAFDVVLTAILIVPPTIMMGGTIPLLTQGFSRDLADATRLHALVYAFNTVGAFLGALGAGFLLVPALGLPGSVNAMGLINVFAGLVFVLVGRSAPEHLSDDAAQQEAPATGAASTSTLALSIVALAAGFAMMALQTSMNRIAALALGASHFTFAMIVAVFVFCIALGSFAVSAFRRIRPGFIVLSQWLLVGCLLALYPFVDQAPYWAQQLRTGFGQSDAEFFAYHLAIFARTLVIFLVPLALSGATLPLLFHHLRNEQGDLGGVAGRLYSWNTVGSLLGALMGGYVLLAWLDLHHVYRLSVAALSVGALILTIRITPTQRLVGVGGLISVSMVLVVLPAWNANWLTSGLFRKREPLAGSELGPRAFFDRYPLTSGTDLLYYGDDPAMTVSMRSGRDNFDLSISTNGKSEGSIPRDNATMGMAALLPALLADDPEEAFVVGYGTGFSVGYLGQLYSMKRVLVAEISPGVIEAAEHFEEHNFGALANRKVEVIQSDAYRALLRSDRQFDVIVSEPSNPWATGIEMLYSLEFLQAARSRLSPGGVYLQWFHLYETDSDTLQTVLRTYLEAFDTVSVWMTVGVDLLIVGFNEPNPSLDLERLRERFEQPDMRAGFELLEIDDFGELLAHEVIPVGVLEPSMLTPRIHTLYHPILSLFAARAFFRGQTASLPFTLSPQATEAGARNSLFGQWLRSLGDDEASNALRAKAIAEACFQRMPETCATYFAHWLAEDPDSDFLLDNLVQARSSPTFGRALSPAYLVELSRLFAADASPEASGSYDDARNLTALYTRHYEHATPFHVAPIRAAWQSCADDPRCVAMAQRVYAELGGAGASVAAE